MTVFQLFCRFSVDTALGLNCIVFVLWIKAQMRESLGYQGFLSFFCFVEAQKLVPYYLQRTNTNRIEHFGQFFSKYRLKYSMCSFVAFYLFFDGFVLYLYFGCLLCQLRIIYASYVTLRLQVILFRDSNMSARITMIFPL